MRIITNPVEQYKRILTVNRADKPEVRKDAMDALAYAYAHLNRQQRKHILDFLGDNCNRPIGDEDL